MIEENEDLPRLARGWLWTNVGQIYDIVGGGTPSTKVKEYWNGDIPWITSADIYGLKDIRPQKFVTKEGIAYSATNLVPERSIVVVTRVGLGKIALAEKPLCFSQDSQALIGNSSLVHPEYALHYLSVAVQIFKYKHRGTTIGGVTKKQLHELPFPLAPYNEQKRIVERVEELFTRLDAGVEGLRKIKAQLKRYRQAVLKYAFEGKLTEEWRKTRKNQIDPTYKLVAELDISNLFQLPQEWTWIKVKELGELISGQHILKENYNSNGVGLPYLTGPADFGKKNPIISKWTTRPKVVASNGDVLITVKGAGVGKVNILNIDKAAISRQLMAIRNQRISSSLLFYYLRFTFDQIQRLGSGSTVPGIRREELLELPVPFCSPPEQERIVHQVEIRMAVAYEIEKAVEQNLKRAEQLRQSMLKNAFKGKLVSQDSSDEPAERLLERIRVERAKSQGETDMNKKKIKPKQLELSTYVK